MTDLEPALSPIVVRPTAPPPVAYSDVDFTISAETAQMLWEATAENTRAAYDWAWRNFENWCLAQGRIPLPATPHTLTEYVRHMCTEKSAPNTIAQAISTVRSRHADHGHPDEPNSKEPLRALKTYRRGWAKAGNREKQAVPIMVQPLRAMSATCNPAIPKDARDRALLLLGFNMMARRSELVGLDMDDVVENTEGLTVFIKMSKTDQDAQGQTVTIVPGRHAETCAVTAIREWKAHLVERGLTSGPLFRPFDRHGRIGGEPEMAGKVAVRLTGKSACTIVHNRGVVANQSSDFTSHGLRAGGASTAYAHGVPISEIAAHGRWSLKSPVLLRYIRFVDQLKNNPMRDVGL